MHRTTTTATLLVTVAVSALSGCVTVQRPLVSGPPAPPSQPSAPRQGGQSEPQIVQAPVREALEMIGPSRRPDPTAAPPHGGASSTPPQAHERPPGSHPVHPAHPEPRRPEAGRHGKPPVELPDVAKAVPKDAKDVCALGRQYGGWRADSPEAVICEQTYGR
ncbi:hypothetical protein OG252_41785 [Streptomyces sp. NBC_01352]|uniref:hypothetical protein n=1 Tax=unclassified Streptomyces TaxID=2593676 RepID=UPI00225649C0|nr:MULTISPECIES: hypothetical protein [unclassified Streptomyces]MCX4702469.1 hypothetical protein [Streptomyces sp. NBC_01373]